MPLERGTHGSLLISAWDIQLQIHLSELKPTLEISLFKIGDDCVESVHIGRLG